MIFTWEYRKEVLPLSSISIDVWLIKWIKVWSFSMVSFLSWSSTLFNFSLSTLGFKERVLRIEFNLLKNVHLHLERIVNLKIFILLKYVEEIHNYKPFKNMSKIVKQLLKVYLTTFYVIILCQTNHFKISSHTSHCNLYLVTLPSAS